MSDDPKLKDEIEKMPYEPLLPAEKKMILGSLGLGIVLLVIFVFLTRGMH